MTTFDYANQQEAHKAIVNHFVERNAARGQYPKRIAPKRDFICANPDGSVEYMYTYKQEHALMIWSCYKTTVITWIED